MSSKATSKTLKASKSKPGKSHRGRKPEAKQPVPLPDRLKRLFNSLCAQIDGGHFTNAIKTCDKILRLDPTDKDALQTKLFLYLQTEQNLPALELSEKGHWFEQAYALYRMQREDEAAEVLKQIKEDKGIEDRGVIHLEAQLNYRQGAYQSAYDLYDQLLDTAEPGSEEHSDILTNLQAAQQHLDFINSGFSRVLDTLPASLHNTIETLLPPTQTSSSSTASAGAGSSNAVAARGDTNKTSEPVTKKVRMKRVPKGVVPGVTPPPDPERWLKKSERSTFGQGRKRKGGGGGGGATQGVSLDIPPSASGGSGSAGGKSSGGKGKKRK